MVDHPDPTRVEGGEEPSTVDAPSRWSGAAAVPPPEPKKSWWSRHRPEVDERTAVPAVDPWAGQDTPIDPMPVAVPIEKTKIDAPPAAPQPVAPAPAAPPPPVPPPAVPLPTTAPKLSRREKKAQARAASARPPANRLPVQTRPAAPPPPPPPWAAQRTPQRPLPPPRRRRRRGRLLLVATVIAVGTAAYFHFPALRQYPVSAVLPADFSDLSLRDDNASKRAADRLAQALKAADSKDGKAFAGVYGDGHGKRVTIFGVTGWRFTPQSDVSTQLDRLTDEFNLSGVESFSLGEPGAHESCGVGRSDGAAVVVCAWADHGSMATVLLNRRSIKESADLVGRLRSAVLTPG
ncbi:hypothetical protein [Actinoplanes subtropicus]|uniref:hypothetical protein n=1 Tax=Actinoplanes subtropicus TaxID=543632 RepID=UPI000689250F|nr:hypothetical protein [Actinoplanes subtropicus]